MNRKKSIVERVLDAENIILFKHYKRQGIYNEHQNDRKRIRIESKKTQAEKVDM
jgi:hypothetical protein